MSGLAKQPEASSNGRLTCKGCNHWWEVKLPNGISLDEWYAQLELEKCEECGLAYQVRSKQRTEK